VLVVAEFVGRQSQLKSLEHHLDQVRQGLGTGQPGQCVLVRGRRRVGKSRLLEEFCRQSGVPSVFFTAARQGDREPVLFADEVANSDLPGRELFAEVTPDSWDSALRLLATALDDRTPVIVVIDEFPYLVHDDGTVDAVFQKQWDRHLSKKPVLLVLVGSDLAMMEALTTHDRPFFQRGTEMVVPPLSPVETADIVRSREAADAFDAYLLTGGQPLIANSWPRGASMEKFLSAALAEPTSPFIVSAERVLAAEFPVDALARQVLGQIGADHVSFTRIARAAGGLQSASANRSLELLTTKRLVAKELPLSTMKSVEARYRITDPYLRFWLRFVGPHLGEIERARSDLVIARIRRDWETWRGRAIEPVVREALQRLSPVAGLPPAAHVGGFWTRSNDPEIDIIGADRSPIAASIAYAGTVKWTGKASLTASDVQRLRSDLALVPGADDDLPIVAVSRTGVEARGVVALGPDDLLAAW
jgi:hypothetical protein